MTKNEELGSEGEQECRRNRAWMGGVSVRVKIRRGESGGRPRGRHQNHKEDDLLCLGMGDK